MTERESIPLSRILADQQFWLACLAAPLLWMIGVLWLQPATDWAWPLNHPRDLLYLALLYPVVEELLFRGLLQGALLKREPMRRKHLGLTRANLLVSVLFSALHFFAHPPLAALSVLVPSLIFGHFRDRHGSLHAPIALHVFYNLGYFWIFSG